jgi:ABC-type sugar transport system substrate-binding protein
MKIKMKINKANSALNKTRVALIAALAVALSAAASESFAASAGTLTEHVTYTYDVPWDAVHRYSRPLKPYAAAQGCHAEHVTVPRPSGGTQGVNIVRCY